MFQFLVGWHRMDVVVLSVVVEDRYPWRFTCDTPSALDTSSELLFALIDVSSIAAVKLCPVEKVSPRYP